MGLLADFLVGTDEDASRYDGGPTVPDSHRASYTGITEIELTTLYLIAQGLPVDPDTTYDFRTVSEADEGEVVTVEILPDLVRRLAGASDEDLMQWAREWAATEELACEPEDLQPVLQDLRRLALVARAEAKAVYLWNCV